MLVGFVEQTLFERFLFFDGGIRVGAGMVGGAGRCVRCRVVFCEDAGTVVGGEDEDGVDGEERHVGGHVER